MTGTKAAKEPLEWMPRSPAAKLLGVSMRQLERRAWQGFIEKRTGPRNPAERNAPVFYSRADILALKAGTPNLHARPETEARPEPGNLQQSAATSQALAVVPRRTGPLASGHGANLAEAMAAMLANLREVAAPAASVPPSLGVWITVDEAVKRSGLPRYYILREARAGAAWARNVGTEKAPRWRISAEGLYE